MLRRLTTLISTIAASRGTASAAQRTRRYEGAGGGRRWAGAPISASPAADALAARGPVAARARHAVQNSGVAAKGADELAAAIVGTGFGYESMAAPALKKTIEDRFYAWSRRADFHGRATLTALLTAAARAWIVDGEAFIRLRTESGGLRLQLITAEQIDPALTRDLGGGARIVGGVEFDADGRRRAYHILRDPPGQPFAALRETVPVPADDVVHLFTPLSPGQVRGVSWFAPILLRLYDYDRASDAMTVRTKAAACMAGFITTAGEEGFVAPAAAGETAARDQIDLEPGLLADLAPGESISWADLPRIGAETIDFLKTQLREIAAGLGVTYEMISGDLSGVNYSSIRAGLIDFRRRIDSLRINYLIPLFLEPIWRRFLLTDALAGRLPAAILHDFETAAAVEFIPPAWPWVDPLKEIAADREAMAAGIKSRREVVAARGRDIDALDAEIAADRARIAALGLDYNGRPAQNHQEADE